MSIDRKLLKQLVAREMHAIKCASNPRMKARKAISIGTSCLNSGYPRTALNIFEYALKACIDHDYEMVFTPCSGQWWHNAIMKDEVRQLAECLDKVWKQYFPGENMGEYAADVDAVYEDLWAMKFDD
ncbi:MAG: hypothetical protein IJ196_03930 [Prevotella sp.]|nr:hypothetical protein [Prevotella sp.]